MQTLNRTGKTKKHCWGAEINDVNRSINFYWTVCIGLYFIAKICYYASAAQATAQEKVIIGEERYFE